MKTFWVILVFASSTLVANGQRNHDLEEFLSEAMVNYTTWIKNDHLDPSTPHNESISLDITENDLHIVCSLRNMSTLRYSNISHDEILTGSDMMKGHFVIQYLVNGKTIAFSGDYTLVGSIISTKEPITGKGTWAIVLPAHDSRVFFHQMAFHSFKMTEDHYIDMSTARVGNFFYYFADDDDNDIMPIVSLGGLQANGMEDQVKSLVYKHFRSFLGDKPGMYPMPTLIRQHLTEALKTRKFFNETEEVTTTTPKPGDEKNSAAGNNPVWSLVLVLIYFWV